MMCTSKKDFIIEAASKLFFNYGIQHITMDEIADKCGISKKTLYKHFKNKDNLLHFIIKQKVVELKQQISIYKKSSDNSLQELSLFFNYINKLSCTISSTFGRELKKYHSNIFLEVYNYNNTIIVPFIVANIKAGQQEGVYKKDINPEEICESFDNVAKIIFTDGFLSKANQKTINFLNSLFLYRLVSLKGLELLKTYL